MAVDPVAVASSTRVSRPVPVHKSVQTFDVKALLAFVALAYGLSWAWVIPFAATGFTVRQGDGWPTHVPSLLGPMLAAFVVTAWTTRGPGVRDLLARMVRWRIGWRWWLVSSSPLAFLGVALGAVVVLGDGLPPRGDFARFSGLPSGLGILGVAMVIIVVNGFGEETGWRGYALAQLQTRYSALAATLIVAVIWAGWHVPLFFFLHSYQGFSVGTGVGFVFGLACGSVVATWLYNRTGGSILAVVVWHGIYNAAAATRAATGGPGTIAAVVSALIIVQAIVLVRCEQRARRRGEQSVLGPR